MPHACAENLLVEQPAIGLFAERGWAVAGLSPNAGVAGEPRRAGWRSTTLGTGNNPFPLLLFGPLINPRANQADLG